MMSVLKVTDTTFAQSRKLCNICVAGTCDNKYYANNTSCYQLFRREFNIYSGLELFDNIYDIL